MKKIMIMAAALVISMSACAQNNKSDNPAATVKKEAAAVDNAASETKPVEMTSAMFREKVMDYKTQKDWKYKGEKPVIIDFYATWCGPCRQLSPILDELAGEYAGKIDFYKVDVDKEQELAAVFGVQSIPMVLFVPVEGKPTAVQGLQPKENLVEAINKVLSVK